MTENQEKDKNGSDLEDTSKLFAEVKTSTKKLIEKIKNELTAEEVKKEKLDPEYKKKKITISTVIEEAIDIYQNYESISLDIQKLIKKYTAEYGNPIKVIEEALKLLDQEKNLEKRTDRDLWIRARDEMKMLLIGKTTFNQLIAAAEAPKESLDKPFKRNVALDSILWITGKPLKNLSLEEILFAIKRMWTISNYFYLIDIKKENEDQYHIIFKHRQNRRYSNYWLGYFTELFTSEDLPCKCIVEGQAFDETISMTIKKAFNRKNVELEVI
ncbi:MAG: hypothetical protein ACFFAN_18335 [Promethearchaeota archaeon]